MPVISKIWRRIVTRRFKELFKDMPEDRQRRAKERTEALLAENRVLKALRKGRDVSQQELASLLGVQQASVSKFENQDDIRLTTLRKYVEALGGELELRVRFPDEDVRLAQFSTPSREKERDGWH